MTFLSFYVSDAVNTTALQYNQRRSDDGTLFSLANRDEESQQRCCVSVSGVCTCLNTHGVVKLKDDMHNILEAIVHVLLLNNWLLRVLL